MGGLIKAVPKKFIRTAADKQAVKEGARWNEDHFNLFQDWCEEFAIQSQGKWSHKPLHLMDFQIDDIFKPLLSWRKPDGNYLKNLALIFSMKKVGKTTCIAALAGWKAMCFRDQSIYIMASSVKQAGICFDTISKFKRHPVLAKNWHLQEHIKKITDKQSGSTIQILAGGQGTISGYGADLFIIDETSEHPKHQVQKCWDRLEFSGAAKENSQIISITTPSHELDHLGYRLYQRCNRLLKGEDFEDTATLPVVYSVPTDEDWEDEEVWKKYLPHLNKTVSIDFYRKAYRRAKTDISEEMAMRIYLLGQYVRNKHVFVDLGQWAKCKRTKEIKFKEKPRVAIGLDNGGSNDLMGITVLIPYEDKVIIEPRAILSEQALHKKNKTGQVQYQAWYDQGLLEVVDTETITFETVLRILEDIYQKYEVAALAYDPWQLSDLQDEFLKLNRLTIETPQFGKYLSPLILDFERKIKEETFVHYDHPVMIFCVENFQVKENKFGKLEFQKENSRSKIDLACSTVVALNALPEACKAPLDWKLPSIFQL